MKSTSTFQLILLTILGFIAVIAVLMFAGVIPGGASFIGTKAGGTIVVWGPYSQDNIIKYFELFNTANKATVKIKYEAKAPETYLEDLIEAFARGTGPDLFFVDQKMLNRLAGKIADIPYTSYPERDFQNIYADGASVFTTNSGLRAIPLLIDPLVMYYNKTLYSSAGFVLPPDTWQGLAATLPAINKQDDRKNFTQTGVAMGEFRNITNAKYILSTLMFQAGNPISSIDSQGNYSLELTNSFGFTPPPADAAATFYLQFSDPTLSVYSWNRSLDNDKNMFVIEKAATYFGFGSELADLQAKNPHLNLDAAPVPQKDLNRRVTYGNFYGLAIAGNSKNKALAMNTAVLLSSAKNLEDLSVVLAIPPARRDLLAAKSSDPWMQAFKESAIIARSWIDPEATKTTTIMAQMLENVQTGQAKINESVRDAEGKINLLFNQIAVPAAGE